MAQICTDFKLSEKQQSVEIPNSGGARKSNLDTDGNKIGCAHENLKTTWDALLEGKLKSGNDRCFGWRTGSELNYFWITYNEFLKKAENFGSGLKKIGLNPGQSSKVGIYAKTSVEWAVAQYGIWSQSAVLVPLYDSLGPDASIFMINQAEIEIVICDNEKKVRHLLCRKSEIPLLKSIITMDTVKNELMNDATKNITSLFSFREVEEFGEKFQGPLLYPKSSDIALICYTSGTTGDPKGALITHENLMLASISVQQRMGEYAPSKEDTVLSYLPMAHMYGQIFQLLLLMVGGSIGIFSGDINQLVDEMRILKPTGFPAVPRILSKIYKQAQIFCRSKSEIDFSANTSTLEFDSKSIYKPFKETLGGRVRFIICGAAPIYRNVLEFFTKYLDITIMEGYGLTECSGPCAFAMRNSDCPGDVGTPIPRCIVKLADVQEMGYLSKNSTGEICIKGPGVFQGYLKNPEKTAEALDSDGWLHTGDIGMWLPNGALKIIDRKKNILKLSQGLYVALEKIENIYSLSPFVSQVFVDGDSLKSTLFAIVVPEKETLLSWCDKNLETSDSWNDICKNTSIKKLIFEDMLKKGKETGLLSFEQVKDIHLYPELLTHEGGFFTPTSKLKRNVWRKYFTKEITALLTGF